MQHTPVTSSFWWGKFVSRADLPKTTKQIATIMVFWGDEDGSNVRPGNRVLAAAVGIQERSVREHLKLLRELGLIERVGFGRSGGRADVYQLTTPGAGYPAIPMLYDPHWQPITDRTEGRRSLSEIRAAAKQTRAATTGTPVPEAGAVDNDSYRHPGAASEAVDNPDYRHPRATNRAGADESYRHPGAELPAPRCQTPGTPVPPTTHTTHDQPTTGSPQAGTSLATGDLDRTPELARIVTDPMPDAWTPDVQPADDPAPHTVSIALGTAVLQPTAEALAILDALPDGGRFLQLIAARELRGEGESAPSMTALAQRAAEILQRPETRSA